MTKQLWKSPLQSNINFKTKIRVNRVEILKVAQTGVVGNWIIFTVTLSSSSILIRIKWELAKGHKSKVIDIWIIFPTSPRSTQLKFRIKSYRIVKSHSYAMILNSSSILIKRMTN